MQFNINGGNAEFKTKMGALFSLVMMVMLVAFGASRFVEMTQRDNTQLQITKLEDHFDIEYTYEGNDMLKIAYGLV